MITTLIDVSQRPWVRHQGGPAGALLGASPGCRQGVSQAVSHAEIRSSFKLFHVVGRIQFLVILGLGFPAPRPPGVGHTRPSASLRWAGEAPSCAALGSHSSLITEVTATTCHTTRPNQGHGYPFLVNPRPCSRGWIVQGEHTGGGGGVEILPATLSSPPTRLSWVGHSQRGSALGFLLFAPSRSSWWPRHRVAC